MSKPSDGPRQEAGRRGGAPTPQGPKSAGPGNRHGVPPEDSPEDSALEALRPVPPGEAEPARDPDRMAERVLRQAERGPKAQGDAGPRGAESGDARGAESGDED